MAASLDQPEPFVDAEAVAVFLCVERRQVLEMTRKKIIPTHPLGTEDLALHQPIGNFRGIISHPRPIL